MTLKNLVKQIFDECSKEGEPVTMEEATEMAKMELKSKENCKNYTNSATKKPKKEEEKFKTVKVSAEKMELFNLLWEGLLNYYENAEILKQNKLISVQIGEKTFKIDIIETRQKKG
jgi:hypothetical protein